jgi:23S rRNA (uracil1939-C5)-methyltransferase
LARDVRFLTDGGYHIQRYRPVDMFPQTVHVETVVVLSLKEETERSTSKS